MIKLADIDDLSDGAYLDQNPDFAKQLVATLNRVDSFSANDLWFKADSCDWTCDYWISPNYEIENDAFVIGDDQIIIQSTNRDDLLNIHYYPKLTDLANNYPIKRCKWQYFAQDRVLQFNRYATRLNIKLSKPINQYRQNQLNAIGKFMTNVYQLIIKDDQLDWKQFDEWWKQRFGRNNAADVGIVFDLNDIINPKILIRWLDQNNDNHYENDLLKQVLKPEAPLLDYLKQFEQEYHQLNINQVDQIEQVNANKVQIEINSINDDLQPLNQPLSENFDLYVGAKGKTTIAALNNLVKNIKAIVQHDHSIKQWFLSDLKTICQEEQAIYTISGKLNIIIN